MSIKVIHLSQDKFALVDDEDFDFLMQWKWHYVPAKSKYKETGYARRNGKWIIKDGKKKRLSQVLMHRAILKDVSGIDIDHKDNDGLNNQKYNLRTASDSKNRMNCRTAINSTSQFKGVSWKSENKKWVCQIVVNKVKIHIGYFDKDKEIEAAKAYDEMALKHFGEFAKLNFPLPL